MRNDRSDELVAVVVVGLPEADRQKALADFVVTIRPREIGALVAGICHPKSVLVSAMVKPSLHSPLEIAERFAWLEHGRAQTIHQNEAARAFQLLRQIQRYH